MRQSAPSVFASEPSKPECAALPTGSFNTVSPENLQRMFVVRSVLSGYIYTNNYWRVQRCGTNNNWKVCSIFESSLTYSSG